MLLGLALFLAALFPAGAAAVAPFDTFLVDRPSDPQGLPFDHWNFSFAHTSYLSDDGRYAVFGSAADLISDADDNSFDGIYRRDLQTGDTEVVSVGTAGAPANGSSFDASVSDNGQYVAFVSEASNLVVGDTNGVEDVFVRDMVAGTTVRVSRKGAQQADKESSTPVISGSGEFVAFRTQTTFDAGDPDDNSTDVYRADRDDPEGDAVVLVSEDGGSASGGDNPAITDDGGKIAFLTGSPLDSTNDTNGQNDAYVWDATSGNSTLVSRPTNADTAAAGAGFSPPAISGDGNSVAFFSQADDLSATNDDDGSSDLYIRSGTSTVLGNTTDSNTGDGAALSDNGGKVSFLTDAALDTDDDNGFDDVYIRTLSGSTVELASRADGADGAANEQGGTFVQGVALSGDGHSAGFVSDGSLVAGLGGGQDVSQLALRRLSTHASPDHTELVSRPDGSGAFQTNGDMNANLLNEGDSAVSDRGRYVVFRAANSALPGGSARVQVYLRDTVAGVTTLVSRSAGGAPGNDDSFDPSISADGRRIAFLSFAGNLPVDGGPDGDVFVYDVPSGTYEVASVGTPGQFGDDTGGVISGDGTKVLFGADNDILPGDTNGLTDVYRRDIDANTTVLGSVGDDGAPAYGRDGSISEDGSRIAFISSQDDVAVGDSDDSTETYVRDLAAGDTILASRKTNGATLADNEFTQEPQISGDGKRVAFMSADDLDPTDAATTNGNVQIWLRDIPSATTTFVTANLSGQFAGDEAQRPRIDRDGSTVAFDSPADNLVAGDVTAQTRDIYLYDVASGTLSIGSRGSGAAGPQADQADESSLSRDGSCLAFTAEGEGLDPALDLSPDFEHVFLRALDSGCDGATAAAPPGPGQGPIAQADTTDPRFVRASLLRRRFGVSRRATPLTAGRRPRVRLGTEFRFTLSEAAQVQILIERALPGRRRGRRCVAPRRGLRRKCTRYRRAGTLTRAGKLGANRVKFSGRIGRRALRAGRYRALLTARDAAGNTTDRPRTLTFTVVRR